MPRRRRSRARKGAKVYGRPWKKPFTKMTTDPNKNVFRRSDHRDIPSLGVTPQKEVSRDEYTGELAVREQEALLVARKRRSQVAPLYNKGAYQYIGGVEDKEVIRDLGRKK